MTPNTDYLDFWVEQPQFVHGLTGDECDLAQGYSNDFGSVGLVSGACIETLFI